MGTKKMIVEVMAALFVLLFLYTSIEKLKDFDTYSSNLEKLPLIGNFAIILSWFVPFAELTVAALLVFPSTRKLGFLLTAITLFVFAAYISYMKIMGNKLPCTCGAAFKQLRWSTHLLFNLIFSLAALIGYYMQSKQNKFIAIRTGAAEHL